MLLPSTRWSHTGPPSTPLARDLLPLSDPPPAHIIVIGCPSPITRPASNRMLKKSASGVLTSLRGSTYRSVRLASSFAAALLDGLFEHPAGRAPVITDVQTSESPACPQSFSTACKGPHSFWMSHMTRLTGQKSWR